ncbi:hypothetical protein BJV74DRAFT_342536 [Russula compacta]|nr:hypothetical protein BJV74DRAFT_342536 [Russula compacta]
MRTNRAVSFVDQYSFPSFPYCNHLLSVICQVSSPRNLVVPVKSGASQKKEADIRREYRDRPLHYTSNNITLLFNTALPTLSDARADPFAILFVDLAKQHEKLRCFGSREPIQLSSRSCANQYTLSNATLLRDPTCARSRVNSFQCEASSIKLSRRNETTLSCMRWGPSAQVGGG